MQVYDSHLCAQGVEKNSTDTCQGDSGKKTLFCS